MNHKTWELLNQLLDMPISCSHSSHRILWEWRIIMFLIHPKCNSFKKDELLILATWYIFLSYNSYAGCGWFGRNVIDILSTFEDLSSSESRFLDYFAFTLLDWSRTWGFRRSTTAIEFISSLFLTYDVVITKCSSVHTDILL